MEKIRVNDDLHDLSSMEAEFTAIVINDAFAPQDALQCKSQVSTPVNDEIDFRISFDESDDEDYTIICDKNSFSYKMIYVNDLKTDSENDNEKGVPSIPSPEPAISCFGDLDFFKDFENEFPAIVYNDAQMSTSDLLTELTLNPQHIDKFDLNDETSVSEYDEEEQNILYFNDLFHFNIICPDDLKSEKDNDNNEIDITQSSDGNEIIHGSCVLSETNMALPPREQRHPFLRYEGLQYTKADIEDFEMRLTRIYRREVHRVQVFYFGGSPDLMAEELSARMLMEHRDDQGIDPRKGGFKGLLDGDLICRIFPWHNPSYTVIRDPNLRLCHRLIACSIAGRSQAPEKVTVTDLFYLRGMDVDSVNVPYLLARYLRLFAAGRKSGAHISGGQFVARLAEHFGLLTAEILGGLTVIVPELPIIDMAELVRLQICAQFDDTWAWVAIGPERQPDAMAGAVAVAEDALATDEGDQAILTLVQAPQQPPPPTLAVARTMPQRVSRLEEDMHEIRRALTEQREVIDAMAHDFSRFSTWVVTSLGQMIDRAGVTYVPYSQTHIPYQRRVRRKTDEASTSAAQQDTQIKPGSKFNTIVHEYVTEPSSIFTLDERMGNKDDFKCVFEGRITIYNGDDKVTYQMMQSHLRFKNHTNEQCNKIQPLLKVSEVDKKNGISHAYQKLKGFYKGVLNLGPNYIRDVKMEEWLTRGHISVHEIE
ncbi:hypothetical protein Tco_0584419 [Tanacetum coccineum]